jgi:DNA-binding protein HU-beta
MPRNRTGKGSVAKKATPVRNLSKSISAAKSATKKVVKVITAPAKQIQKLSKRKSYTFRDLPIKQSNSLPKLLTELETRADDLDALKRPGEYWAFTLLGHKSHQVFESLDLMLGKLRQYKLPTRKDDMRDMVEGIRFVKFGGRGIDTSEPLDDDEYDKLVGEYQAGRERTVRKRRKERVKMEAEQVELVTKKTGVKPRDNFEVMKGILGIAKKLEATNAALTKKLAKLEKELRASKSSTKKGKATNAPKGKQSGAKATAKVSSTKKTGAARKGVSKKSVTPAPATRRKQVTSQLTPSKKKGNRNVSSQKKAPSHKASKGKLPVTKSGKSKGKGNGGKTSKRIRR